MYIVKMSHSQYPVNHILKVYYLAKYSDGVHEVRFP